MGKGGFLNLNRKLFSGNIGIMVWARSLPKKEVFKEMIVESHKINNRDPIFFIDDVCARYTCHRSVEEQESYNRLYANFFEQLHLEYYFSSEFLDEELFEYSNVYSLLQKITLKEYYRVLPQRKKKDRTFESREILHTILQELFLQQILNKVDAILLGKFSKNMIFFHKSISNKSITYFIIERINVKENSDAGYTENF